MTTLRTRKAVLPRTPTRSPGGCRCGRHPIYTVELTPFGARVRLVQPQHPSRDGSAGDSYFSSLTQS
jgi:hypothetical protein